MGKIRVAQVGCGRVAEMYHLPVLARSDGVEVAMLVDSSVARARELAERYGVPSVTDDYRQAIGRVDAAIVAVPNALHAGVTKDLLRGGVHVLVEKPMALALVDCDEMIDLAQRMQLILAVGLEFRFFYVSQFVKRLLEHGVLGEVREFDVQQGLELKWSTRSGYLVQPELAGGGVLVDFGVHLLDLLIWWLGECAVEEYSDDAMGGVEAECELRLRMASGAQGTVELSRLRNMRNTCLLRSARGELEVGMWDPGATVRLRFSGQEFRLAGKLDGLEEPSGTFRDAIRRQWNDFADAILTRRDPFVSGGEGRRAVGVIERCYASRKPLTRRWLRATSDHSGRVLEK